MKYYTYKDREIELLRHMLDNPPKKIWWDFVCYVFDYDDYYLKLECVSELADTQNQSDEAIIATLTKEDKDFEPTEHTELVCEDKPIDNIYIVRTFLYFTTFREYSHPEKFAKRTIQKLKTILTGKKDPIGDLVSTSVGGCEEIICHPKSEQVGKVNTAHANLLDVGLLLEIEGKCLKAYLESNGYGFHIWNNKYFFDPDDLKEDVQLYEYIKIENKKMAANKTYKQ